MCSAAPSFRASSIVGPAGFRARPSCLEGVAASRWQSILQPDRTGQAPERCDHEGAWSARPDPIRSGRSLGLGGRHPPGPSDADPRLDVKPRVATSPVTGDCSGTDRAPVHDGPSTGRREDRAWRRDPRRGSAATRRRTGANRDRDWLRARLGRQETPEGAQEIVEPTPHAVDGHRETSFPAGGSQLHRSHIGTRQRPEERRDPVPLRPLGTPRVRARNPFDPRAFPPAPTQRPTPSPDSRCSAPRSRAGPPSSWP